jgi:hypothetical protein
MSGAPRLRVGSVRPDGTRRVKGTDGAGLLLRGEVGPEPLESAPAPRILSAEEVARLAAIMGRAPSVHNTQPWTLRTAGPALELLADPGRQLRRTDPAGREMLVSCGAALFGLRLGLRSLGCLPLPDLLPDPDQPDLVARLHVAGQAAMTRHESELLAAAYHRHTHRGTFVPGEVSPRLVDGLRTDAIAENAQLIVLPDPAQVRWLAGLVLTAARDQSASSQITAEMRDWTRPAGSSARDGVPAFARLEVPERPDAPEAASQSGLRLPPRDYGEPGLLPGAGSPPPVTAVLVTASDRPADWIMAGQALHRILLHAATRWVFASLQSQPLELPALRAELSRRLDLPGAPQMILQFGRSNTAAATPRRPVSDTLA